MITWLSLVFFFYSLYVYLRQVGILHFMPSGINKLMTEVSFFDILVNIFIYRKVSKMVLSIVSPFLNAQSPE